MAAYGIARRFRTANDLAAGRPEVELFRLRAIAGELDRAWHVLRERAERLGLRASSERGRA
jgi:hypothetical protein